MTRYICKTRRDMGDTTNEPMEATHICSELGREVCTFHAGYCVEDGHTAELIDEQPVPDAVNSSR